MSSVLENNEDIVNDIRELYFNSSPSKIRDLIAFHFIPSEEEKKKNAEVSTPKKLVDEMLNKVPTEFWTTPKKVFEPCCGKGNFVLGVFDMFYKGLENRIDDKVERCRIIIEECIYYSDITNLNVFITTQLLHFHSGMYINENKEQYLELDDYEFNSNIGNTLDLDIEDKWGIDGFDLVVGNPPYNSSGNTSTGNTIWQYFTKISLNKLLKNNGYLLYVHPSGWRKPNTERGKFYGLYKLMTQENQMLYLSIHGIKDGKQTFNCGTRYDWYIIQHTCKYTTTIVNDEKNNNIVIDMNKFDWLPNYNIDTIKKILREEKLNEFCPIIQSMSAYEHRQKWMSKTKNEEFKYPCIHSTPKSGIRYMYSSRNDNGHFGISKVIFGESGINHVVIDMNGKYGITNGGMGIKVSSEKEAKQIKKALLSIKFKDFLNSVLFSSFRVDWNIFKSFKRDFWKEFMC